MKLNDFNAKMLNICMKSSIIVIHHPLVMEQYFENVRTVS